MIKYQKWLSKNTNDMHRKTVIITGANSGIGFEATKYLAFLGAHIILACRSEERARTAMNCIKEEMPEANLEFLPYDQSSIASITAFIKTLEQRHILADVFVGNAGIYHPQKASYTKENLPLTMGTNYFGLFALSLSFPSFMKPSGRIIFVSSLIYRHGKLTENFLFDEKSKPIQQYANSKLALAMLFHQLCKNENFIVTMMHPGVSNTNIVSSSGSGFSHIFQKAAHMVMPLFTQRPAKAALGIVKLASGPTINKGDYYVPRGIGEIAGLPKLKKEKKMKDDKCQWAYDHTMAAYLSMKENDYVRSK